MHWSSQKWTIPCEIYWHKCVWSLTWTYQVMQTMGFLVIHTVVKSDTSHNLPHQYLTSKSTGLWWITTPGVAAEAWMNLPVHNVQDWQGLIHASTPNGLSEWLTQEYRTLKQMCFYSHFFEHGNWRRLKTRQKGTEVMRKWWAVTSEHYIGASAMELGHQSSAK